SRYEVMLSESEERMLVIARPGREGVVARAFPRPELQGGRIGDGTVEERLTFSSGAEVVATVPPAWLPDAAAGCAGSLWVTPPPGARSIRRRRGSRGGGAAERRVRRRDAARDHGLPQSGQPRTARRGVAARANDRRHLGGVCRARRSGRVRQRVAL